MNDCYDNHIPALQKLAADTNANVVTFDYRGIEGSRGVINSKKSILKDAQLIMDYLTIGKEIEKEDILFYGHSLGGGIAAEYHMQIKHEGALVLETPFNSFSSAISAKGGIFSRIHALTIQQSNWDFNTTEPFTQAKKKGIIFNRRDPIVRHEASLYQALKKEKKFSNTSSIFRTIKVATKPQHESMDKKSVKVIHSNVKIQKVPSNYTPEEKTGQKKYQDNWAKIKQNKRLQQHLHLPHDRVMDRVMNLNTLPENKAEQNLIQPFQKKFRAEDLEAYNHVVSMIKDLL